MTISKYMTSILSNCKICGKLEHHARGLCKRCYSKNINKLRKKKCQICGSSNYQGRGLCKACYSKEITEPKVKEKRKIYRELNPIIVQKDLLCNSCGKLGCFAKNMCKKCYNKEWSAQESQKLKRQQWRESHEEYEKERKRLHHLADKDRYNIQSKEYYNENKEVLLKKQYQYKKKRIKKDPQFRVTENLRALIRESFKRRNCEKKCKTTELLGTTVPKAMKYLESQFIDGMTWENQGRGGWHVDHFVPINAFDLRYIEHQKICFHYTNLQPLWEKDNIKKSDIIPMGYDKKW